MKKIIFFVLTAGMAQKNFIPRDFLYTKAKQKSDFKHSNCLFHFDIKK